MRIEISISITRDRPEQESIESIDIESDTEVLTEEEIPSWEPISLRAPGTR